MGTMAVMLLFLIFSFHFYPSSSSRSPLPRITLPVHLQENVGGEETNGESISKINHIGYRDGALANRRTLYAVGARGGGGGGGRGGSSGGGRSGSGGGQPVGNGREANGGSSNTPNNGAGAAVIPLYAAGAANAHRSRSHSGASSHRSRLGLSNLWAVIPVSLLAVIG
ncbi:hypothetical protein NMG60_11022097 [Bertholletia excelsa]